MTQKYTEEKKGLGNTNSKPISVKRSRGYVFTMNNYSKDDWHKTLAYFQSKKCVYILGKEIGELNGTPHIQGYVYFNSAATWGTLKKNLKKGTHIEVAKGNTQANYVYCSKEGDFTSNIDTTRFKTVQKTKEEFNDWRAKILIYMTDIKNYPWEDMPMK